MNNAGLTVKQSITFASYMISNYLKNIMKNLYMLPFLIVLVSSCGTIANNVTFENKRTPLNPIAHTGIRSYNVTTEMSYLKEAEKRRAAYQAEITALKEAYQKKLSEYNQTPLVERVALGMKKPILLLPREPKAPYAYNSQELNSKIAIEGLAKGNQEALNITLDLKGYEVQDPKKNIKTKTRKKDDVEYVDTTYQYSANVRHPIAVNVTAPNGETFNKMVPQTTSWKKISANATADTLQAFNNLLNKIDKEEKKIAISNTTHVNNLLNSEFGTSDVRYNVTLYSYKSNKKKDYSDLDQAMNLAEYGLKTLNGNPNKAIEEMNKAFLIYQDVVQEYDKGYSDRMSDKIVRGVFQNIIAVSIFTQNWEAANKAIIRLDRLQPKGSELRSFNYLKTILKDLQARYKVQQ